MRKINTATVVGAGYMGGGIAQVLALNGFQVTIADASAEATHAALKRLETEAREFEEQGLFPEGSADTIVGNLTAADTIEAAVADVDFIEEAVFEDPDVKKDVLARISAAARPDAIIGTNTSTIPVKVLVEAVTNPERFLTVHFSNPAPFIPGVELVAGEATTQEVIDAVKDLLVRAGREGAQVADTPGMALNRLQFALLKEATLIVEEGVATAEDVDTIVRTTFGFRLGFFGPFAIADQAGLDVYAKAFRTLENAFGPRMATPKLLTDTVDAGRHGTKNGKGWTGDFDDETKARLIAYRNKAYSRMADLLRELGPAPRGS
ncbi:3-hydroxyacyl-CoA dehydrogenase [Mycolicibacterium phlei]|uniref:3-hydroxyacyl-CoA dehydrogenase n=1 Tax=Mycolicibacterium phlei DSM 43239 = CCUG 21000 TaxID=1226750 RepID=A0A5N5UN90_MYCPH|nr:3-hydroxyacyl-CoA dehydrogenase family protein [Mycolicibacterium phlei]VEG10488.1 3-hydroxyacyl-CoA dehydrogenase [Mycobacteroides chelonae]AMO62387.1 putative 3-hydroxybutyryl-CoA dehydrogenase [Mycolicibacterium phlei]KAB7751056.1 3-hydroxyacyl-CoA dehydrogenase [Mycolicibacterium phlei DSM 43239 = CCUG 21000]KXW61688.1 3-hydroxyacyl-CoA dehydrogenase [Mycolicibacterium phlei DSM 43239 = CCUG 21000]KXW71205.1 3-hydroxyacyl-CoA dehydrogenase [Mycolicibacterium phlei DSM 43072]